MNGGRSLLYAQKDNEISCILELILHKPKAWPDRCIILCAYTWE